MLASCTNEHSLLALLSIRRSRWRARSFERGIWIARDRGFRSLGKEGWIADIGKSGSCYHRMPGSRRMYLVKQRVRIVEDDCLNRDS